MQKLRENISIEFFFWIKLHASSLRFCQKETRAQVFSCEFCEIFKNTHFVVHLRAPASVFTIDISGKYLKRFKNNIALQWLCRNLFPFYNFTCIALNIATNGWRMHVLHWDKFVTFLWRRTNRINFHKYFQQNWYKLCLIKLLSNFPNFYCKMNCDLLKPISLWFKLITLLFFSKQPVYNQVALKT